jgi:two-component system, chemotaxis family, response regulator Rcp1
MPAPNRHPVDVLLVEHSPAQVRLTCEVLTEGEVRTNVHVVSDGVEALTFLRQEGAYSATPRPDLVLLELDLPRLSGRDVLAAIKTEDRLKKIPVVVLTDSAAEDDVFQSYTRHANCYVIKPANLDQYVRTVKSIEDFWLRTVVLPSE